MATRTDIKDQNWSGVRPNLTGLSAGLRGLNLLTPTDRYSALALGLAEALDDPVDLFCARLYRFEILGMFGRWDEAEEMWNLLDAMGRDWPRRSYRPGQAERLRADFVLYPLGRMTEEDLAVAERLVRAGQNRREVRHLHQLRGEWQHGRGEHALAVESFQDAIRMAHEAGFPDPWSETMLALARFHLKQLPLSDAREEALRLSAVRDPADLALAELWRALADTDQAIKHAKAAYRYAWADGKPYVRRHSLERAETLLRQLGADIPELPGYDPAKHQKEPWEDEVAVAIRELKRSKRSE